jgi:hypothetical protein
MPHPDDTFSHQLSRLTHELKRFCDLLELVPVWFRPHTDSITKHDLKEMEIRIMSAISDFATKQNAFNDRLDSSIQGLTDDVQFMTDQIAKLQASAGTVTPEDQALLDGLEARIAAATTKLEALDALTPPKPPVA